VRSLSLLAQLKGQIHRATSDDCHLVYGLRPPALANLLGLVHAIPQQATRYGLLADGLAQEAGGETSCEGGLVFTVEVRNTSRCYPLSSRWPATTSLKMP
jgi:hypothetical protein